MKGKLQAVPQGTAEDKLCPVIHFSATTYLTNDLSEFRSTRAAALILTSKDCFGPLPSSMWA